MRSILVPVAIAAGLALAPAAFAAQTATGTIKAMDAKTHTVTLDDGTVYSLPASVKEADFKVGEKVTINWDMKAGKHEATTVAVAK